MMLTAIATPKPVNKIIMIKNPSITTRTLNILMLIALLVLTAKAKKETNLRKIKAKLRSRAKVKPVERAKKANLKPGLSKRSSKE